MRRTARTRGLEPGWAYWDPVYLQGWNFHPATIVDVGVGPGTEPLYLAFPKAYLVLVEPLSEFNCAIQALLLSRRGVHIPAAVRAAEGWRTIFGELQHSARGSFPEQCKDEENEETSAREVPVTTLDAIATKLCLPTPYLLKLDTNGVELEILDSAEKFLQETTVVISTVSMMNRLEEEHSFVHLISRMDRLGFSVSEILDVGRAESSEVLQLDLVFRRDG
jgi:FkbM family methyltransferase